MCSREEAIDYVLYNRGSIFTCDSLSLDNSLGIISDSLGNLCYTDMTIIENYNELPDDDWYDITDIFIGESTEFFEKYWEDDYPDF